MHTLCDHNVLHLLHKTFAKDTEYCLIQLLVVGTSATDCLERLFSEVTYTVSQKIPDPCDMFK